MLKSDSKTRIVKPVMYPTARKGSKRGTHFRAMVKYMQKNPRATVADVLADTVYTRQDFIVSCKRKRITVAKAA